LGEQQLDEAAHHRALRRLGARQHRHLAPALQRLQREGDDAQRAPVFGGPFAGHRQQVGALQQRHQAVVRGVELQPHLRPRQQRSDEHAVDPVTRRLAASRQHPRAVREVGQPQATAREQRVLRARQHVEPALAQRAHRDLFRVDLRDAGDHQVDLAAAQRRQQFFHQADAHAHARRRTLLQQRHARRIEQRRHQRRRHAHPHQAQYRRSQFVGLLDRRVRIAHQPSRAVEESAAHLGQHRTLGRALH